MYMCLQTEPGAPSFRETISEISRHHKLNQRANVSQTMENQSLGELKAFKLVGGQE